MNSNLEIKYALNILMTEAVVKAPQKVCLLESHGHILAEDVYSNCDIPPFNRSPLDGYAVRSADIATASKDNPVTLEVVDFIPAGKPSKIKLSTDTAMRIMTGGKIPEGADVIIAFEKTSFTKKEVKIFDAYPSMTNISLKGEDINAGDQVLSKGNIIDSPEIGILASIGKNMVKVYPKPKVAIISTGDELADISDPLKEGQVRNSNSYILATLIKKIGAIPMLIDTCSDDLNQIETKVKQSLTNVDMVITTGGVSVGDRDYVTQAFKNICDKFLFWRVKMKPGTPITAAKMGNKFLFGLSGNPAAAFITFHIFVKPVLLRSMGKDFVEPLVVETTLLNEFSKISKQNRFVRAYTFYNNNGYYTKLPTKHASGIVSSLSGINSLLFVPSGEGPYEKGEKVKVQFLDMEEIKHDPCNFHNSK